MNQVQLLDMPVAAVLEAAPAAARVFIDRRMGCVGCAFAPFETVSEVARIYGADPCELATALAEAGAGPDAPEGLTA